jgi:hypothetical protein
VNAKRSKTFVLSDQLSKLIEGKISSLTVSNFKMGNLFEPVSGKIKFLGGSGRRKRVVLVVAMLG